ncbi:MAG: hypothetical protein SGARI_007204 [Bacillariaceae sp.]
MSDNNPKASKRQKTTSGDFTHNAAPNVVPAVMAASLSDVFAAKARICAFCNVKELCTLRYASKGWKEAVDQEVLAKVDERLKATTTPKTLYRRYSNQAEGLDFHEGEMTIKAGWSEEFSNEESLAASALTFSSKIHRNLETPFGEGAWT